MNYLKTYLEKTAIDPASLMKAVKASTNIFKVPPNLNAIGPSSYLGLNAKTSPVNPFKGQNFALFSKGVGGPIKDLVARMDQAGKKRKAVGLASEGAAPALKKALLKLKQLPDKDRGEAWRALNTIPYSHEQSEILSWANRLKVPATKHDFNSHRLFSHLSPSVLIQENNTLASFPKTIANDKAREIWRDFRIALGEGTGVEAAGRPLSGFKYGETPLKGKARDMILRRLLDIRRNIGGRIAPAISKIHLGETPSIDNYNSFESAMERNTSKFLDSYK